MAVGKLGRQKQMQRKLMAVGATLFLVGAMAVTFTLPAMAGRPATPCEQHVPKHEKKHDDHKKKDKPCTTTTTAPEDTTSTTGDGVTTTTVDDATTTTPVVDNESSTTSTTIDESTTTTDPGDTTTTDRGGDTTTTTTDPTVSTLPNTGPGDVAPLAGAGLAAMAAGVLTVLAARRKEG